MAGTVFHKMRSPVKRVEFKVKHTTRGIHYKQSTLKLKSSPLGSPSKPSQAADVYAFEDDFKEPLIQHKSKVGFFQYAHKTMSS
jgi:hypothetical protein